MLEVRLLGKFEVRVDSRLVELPLRTVQSLLAYLLLNVGTDQRREQVAGLIWPDMTDAKAKDNLRHTLWVIRKALGTAITSSPTTSPFPTTRRWTTGWIPRC
jgi:DNA-binding SARP family transcriptional activator